jgi:hypothetical protein
LSALRVVIQSWLALPMIVCDDENEHDADGDDEVDEDDDDVVE